MNYNVYFPGHMIAMPPPLSADEVTYADGTPATVEQMAHDVTQFLAWVAEPKLEERKQTGLKVDAVPGRAHRPALRLQAQGSGPTCTDGCWGPADRCVGTEGWISLARRTRRP